MTKIKLPDPDTLCMEDDEGGRPIDFWSYSPDLVRQIIAADRALREQAQGAPAWHDAPTVPGVWLNSINNRADRFNSHNLHTVLHSGARWYGPIPQEPAP